MSTWSRYQSGSGRPPTADMVRTASAPDGGFHSPDFCFPRQSVAGGVARQPTVGGRRKGATGARAGAEVGRWAGERAAAGRTPGVRLLAAEARGRDLWLHVVDPHPGAGLGTGEVLQLP